MSWLVRKAIIAVLAAIVVTAIVVAAALRPYYAMPAVDKAALDAKLVEYHKIGEVATNWPTAGRQEIEALSAEIKALPRPEKKPWSDGCPAYDLAALESAGPRLTAMLAFHDRFRALAESGLVGQQNARQLPDAPNYSGLRELVHWELAAAVQEVRQDRTDEALRRVQLALKTADALVRLPELLSVFVGVGIEQDVETWIVYELPRLTPADMQQLRQMLDALPDLRPAFLAAMKVEMAGNVDLVDRLRRGEDTSGELTVGDNGSASRALAWLMRHTGYLKREKYFLLDLSVREMDYQEAWLAKGGGPKYESPIRLAEVKHSILALICWPEFGNLQVRISEVPMRRQAVVQAMDAEQQRRATRQAGFELPCGYERRIVATAEHGCVRKNPAPAADDTPH